MEEQSWLKSDAKKLLKQDILSGDVDNRMEPSEVWLMRYEYSFFEYTKFRTNLRNLQASIRKMKESAVRNNMALQNDRVLHPPVIHWPDSDACRLLKVDMASEHFLMMTKKELWLSRAIYQQYPYRCFYNHVRQVIRSEKERAYWSFKNDRAEAQLAIE